MLKTAFNLGVKIAYDEAGIDPEKLQASPASVVSGGALGALGGGLLGRYLGGQAGEAFDLDEDTARLVGSGLGSLLGGGLGSYVGTQIPKIREKLFPAAKAAPLAEPTSDAMELGVAPVYPDIYSSIPGSYQGGYKGGYDPGMYGLDHSGGGIDSLWY